VEVHYGNQFNQNRKTYQKSKNENQSYKEDFIDVEAEKVDDD
jgi:UPF0716 protein FxsA